MYRAGHGDKAAYARIWEIYRSTVANYLVSLNSNAAGMIWKTWFKRLFSADEKAKKFQGKSSVNTYPNGIARNVWREHLNRHGKADSLHKKLARENDRIAKGPSEETLCHGEAIRNIKKRP